MAATFISPALSHLRDLQKLAIQSAQEWGMRIATWLVLGNAAALVLTLNAAVSGVPCDQQILGSIMWSFAGGGGLALGGAMFGYIASQRALAEVNQIVTLLGNVEMNEISIEKIEAVYGSQPDDGPLDKANDDHLANAEPIAERLKAISRLAPLILIPFAASAVLFAVGSLLPLSGDFLATCALQPRV